jgi:apolipoprotein D and lipocalin family protein
MSCKCCDKLSNLRIIHNVEGAPPVNVYLDDKPLALNLAYKDVSSYLEVRSGSRKLLVKIAGTDTVIASTEIKLVENSFNTGIVLGSVKDLSTIIVKLYHDDLRCPSPQNAHLRFIHGAFGAPAVDVYVNGSKVFSNVKYTETGTPKYAPVPVGKTSIPGANPNYVIVAVKVAGTNTTVVGPVPLYLIGGGIYTLVASGSLENGLSAVFSHDNPNKCEVLQKNFDAQAYMGKWYQIAAIPQFFDRACARSTAQYTLLSDRVNVFNTCYDKEWNVITSITGSAVAPNPCIPAALRVSFPNPPPPAPPLPESPPGPNYLIHNTDYVNYAIVGSPTRNSFYILSRKAKMCESEYKKWLKYAKSLGYDTSLIQANFHAVAPEC